MKRMKGRLLTVLMSLAMAFTMMPIMGTPVYADDPAPAAICLANGAAPNIKGGQKHSIYFGDYPQSEASNVDGLTKDVDYIEVGNKKYLIEPIKWRVLDNPVDVYGNLLDKLLLFSDQNLDCKQYHEQFTSITWKDSTIRDWLNAGFKNTAFLSGEQEALKVTEVENKVKPEYNTPVGENTQDQIFLLSIEEATNEKYGFVDNYNSTTTREAKNTAYATGQGAWTSALGQYAGNGYWWLRSPGSAEEFAALVFDDGYLVSNGYKVDFVYCVVRPALNLNLSSALFTSAAVGGKSFGTVGAGSLKPVGTNTTNEWKMTVKDEAHKDFKVDNITTCDGKTLTIKYSGAVKGDREYISAIVVKSGGGIRSYGRLALASDENGAETTVNIDGKMQDGDKLYVFNEQCNGDYETDFSSRLQEVEIPTELHDWQFDGFEWQQPGQIVHRDGIYASYSCKNDPTHTFKEHNPLVITVSSVAPTCEKDGGAIFTAEMDASDSKDGQYHKGEKEVLEPGTATGHKYGAWKNLDANQHQRVCEHDATHVEKANHSWDAGKVTKPAACTEKGEMTFTCTAEGCEATKTEEIKAKGHTEVVDKAAPATCTKTGLTEGKHCSVCGEVLVKQETVPATGHKYGEWTKLDDKQHQRICENDKKHIEKANHSWNAGKETKPATCTEKGEMTFACTVEGCEATKTEEIKATGHTEEIDKAVTATCTKTGLTEGKHCSVCGEVLVKQETVPATGHKYGEWTKLDADQHQRVCEHDVTHVEKENHKWDTGKVTKAATEQAEGVKTFTCTVCKATKTETIPKLKPSAPKVSGTPLAKATVKNKSMTIGWNKIKGAEGYDVFFATCNHSGKKIACKKVKTIKGNKTFKWTRSGLKKGTAYKFYVRAYVTKNGKKKYVSKTPMFHAYTANGTKNYTNAKSVTVNKTKVTLKKGKTFKIKAKVNKVNKKKKLMSKSHTPTLRYMTSNSKIASVNSGGKITAEGKGTCYIYVYAHNGVSKQVKVTVK